MSKAAASPPPALDSEVVKTGREVDAIVHSLLRHANDSDDSVKSQINFAVHDIGVAQPLLVVSSLVTFMQRNAKLDQAHRIVLIKQLAQLLETQVARDAIEQAEKSQMPAEAKIVPTLIKFCAREMTAAAVRITHTGAAAAVFRGWLEQSVVTSPH